MFDLRPRAAAHTPPNPPLALFTARVQLGWSGAPPDRSITDLLRQQSVTESMPTKPLTIHYGEAGHGEERPTAAC